MLMTYLSFPKIGFVRHFQKYIVLNPANAYLLFFTWITSSLCLAHDLNIKILSSNPTWTKPENYYFIWAMLSHGYCSKEIFQLQTLLFSVYQDIRFVPNFLCKNELLIRSLSSFVAWRHNLSCDVINFIFKSYQRTSPAGYLFTNCLLIVELEWSENFSSIKAQTQREVCDKNR